jgi:hypothetical protein
MWLLKQPVKKGDLETAHKYAAYAAEISAPLEAEE